MKIVVATRNREKFQQIQNIYSQVPVTLVPLSDFDVPVLANTGQSFVEKALLKARHAAQYTGLPSISDDTGLVIDALGGAPGIHSSHYAHPGATDAENRQKVLDAMAAVTDSKDRTARFYCAIVLVLHAKDPVPIICQAEWDGFLLTEPVGTGGFSYDSIFYLPDEKCTVAELSNADRNHLSARARALRKLAAFLPSLPSS